MMKWKAAMSLPEKDDNLFEKIEYLDLQEEEAKKLVAKYNEEGDAFKKSKTRSMDEARTTVIDDPTQEHHARERFTPIHRLFCTRTPCLAEIRTLSNGKIIIKSILSATGNIQAQHRRL